MQNSIILTVKCGKFCPYFALHANVCKYAEEYFAKFTQNQHVHEYALFYPKATILSKGNNI